MYLCTYIYIYMYGTTCVYIHICVCICIYIYITHTAKPSSSPKPVPRSLDPFQGAPEGEHAAAAIGPPEGPGQHQRAHQQGGASVRRGRLCFGKRRSRSPKKLSLGSVSFWEFESRSPKYADGVDLPLGVSPSRTIKARVVSSKPSGVFHVLFRPREEIRKYVSSGLTVSNSKLSGDSYESGVQG